MRHFLIGVKKIGTQTEAFYVHNGIQFQRKIKSVPHFKMSFFEIEMVNKIDSSLLCRYISLFHIFSYSSICFEIFSNTFFQGFYRLTMLKKFFFLHFMEKIDRLFNSALLSCRISIQFI